LLSNIGAGLKVKLISVGCSITQKIVGTVRCEFENVFFAVLYKLKCTNGAPLLTAAAVVVVSLAA
jgi:hypothetical protein